MILNNSPLKFQCEKVVKWLKSLELVELELSTESFVHFFILPLPSLLYSAPERGKNEKFQTVEQFMKLNSGQCALSMVWKLFSIQLFSHPDQFPLETLWSLKSESNKITHLASLLPYCKLQVMADASEALQVFFFVCKLKEKDFKWQASEYCEKSIYN